MTFVRECRESGDIELLNEEEARFRTCEFKDSINRMKNGEVLVSKYNKFYADRLTL